MLFLFLFAICGLAGAQQQQDPTTLNGGSVLAMAGDGCVALAVDKRFGSGPQVRGVLVYSLFLQNAWTCVIPHKLFLY
jgi:hypothetical protein